MAKVNLSDIADSFGYGMYDITLNPNHIPLLYSIFDITYIN